MIKVHSLRLSIVVCSRVNNQVLAEFFVIFLKITTRVISSTFSSIPIIISTTLNTLSQASHSRIELIHVVRIAFFF